MTTQTIRPTLTASIIVSCVLLSSCSDSNNVLATGSGAGDSSDSTDENIGLLRLYAGTYDLADGWAGIMGDQAFLIIREPTDDAQSEAVLIDVNDVDNCIPSRTSTGTVSISPYTGGVFMDGIIQFDQSTLSLAGTTITIEFTDYNDINDNGSNSDLATVDAVSFAGDLGDPC